MMDLADMLSEGALDLVCDNRVLWTHYKLDEGTMDTWGLHVAV